MMLGYAVIDTETTGLNIRGNDRVIEIAVVLLDPNLNVQGVYETILNPSRDLGLVSLHGINGRMAERGAEFSEIMNSLSSLLNGRVIVGHNTRFDIGMLEVEYSLEQSHPDFGYHLDTLQIAKNAIRVPNYKLGTLCEHFGIPLLDAHQASADTLATAHLLRALVQQYGWEILGNGRPANFTSGNLSIDLSAWRSRETIQQELSKPAELGSYITGLKDTAAELSESAITTYLTTIHKTMLNSSYCHWEKQAMEKVISELALDRSHVIDLNEEYIFLLICRTLSHSTTSLSSADELLLTTAANFTNIKESRVQQLLDETLAARHHIEPKSKELASYFQFLKGDSFAITGEEFDYGRNHWENQLILDGYEYKSSVTKATKLVIAKDNHSLSAKAVKARRYGIPVLTEEAMHSLLLPR